MRLDREREKDDDERSLPALLVSPCGNKTSVQMSRLLPLIHPRLNWRRSWVRLVFILELLELRSRTLPRPVTMADAGPSQGAPDAAPTPVFCPGALRQRDPPIFSGTDEHDVEDWLAEYELVAACNKWDANDKLTNLNFYLTDVAKLWYKNHRTDCTTWSDFTTTFTEVFGRPAVRRLRAEQRLRGRVQRQGETFTSYIEDVLSLCKLVDSSLDEAGKIKHILKGIDDDAFQVLAAKSPQTVADVIQLCQSYDELRRQRASTRGAAQDIADLSSLGIRRDGADHTALLPQIKQFIREEVARQLSIITTRSEPMASLTPSLRQVIETQVAEALPSSSTSLPVAAPLTYAAVAARACAPPPPASYQATGRAYTSQPLPTRPPSVPYSANGAPALNPRRTQDNRPICFFCGIPGHVARHCRRRSFPLRDSAGASNYVQPQPPYAAASNYVHAQPPYAVPADPPPVPTTSHRPSDARRSTSPRRRSISPMLRHRSPPRGEN